MRFWKGHALGNDYIVLDDDATVPSPAVIRALCDRHRGVGSDGVLVPVPGRDAPGRGNGTANGPVAPTAPVAAGLRIFNPDGTEAEKSGNGLRIFGAWLHLTGRVGEAPFRVRLPGEAVEMAIEGEAAPGFVTVRVAMGRASFRAGDLAYAGADPEAEVMGAPLRVAGEDVAVHLVSMGNPHCVVFRDDPTAADLRRLGPALQAHPHFTAGVNVQLARVAGPGRLEALIWERGAGETLASGSSACAVAVAARRSGRADGDAWVVSMPGGEVEVALSPDYDVMLRGEAGVVYEGRVRDEVARGWEAGAGGSGA